MIEDHPNVDPAYFSRRRFRTASIGSSILFGAALAVYMTSEDRFKNTHYTNPDYKAVPAMIKKEDLPYDQEVLESYRKASIVNYGRETKKSALYRFFFPLDADFNVVKEPYAYAHHGQAYDPKKGIFPVHSNNYED